LPTLRWRKSNGAIIPGGSIKPGKEMILSGGGYHVLPRTFTVQRRYGALLRRIREHRGQPAASPVDLPLDAIPQEVNAAISEPWVLPTPGRRLKWRLFFEDDRLGRSGEIHLSRWGSFGPSIGVPTGPVELGVQADFTASVDPVARFRVLTPWQEEGVPFRDLLGELVEEGDTALDDLLEPYLPSAPPEGWKIGVSQDEFSIAEGESVNVSAQIHAPTAGGIAFALEMAAEVEGEIMIACSDPMVVEVPEDGDQPALLFSDGGDCGGATQKRRRHRGRRVIRW